MYIKRYLESQITDALNESLVTILYGARQVGKTTLANIFIKKSPSSLYLNCDDPQVVIRLRNQSFIALKELIAGAKLVVIDEAQRVENIGLTAKMLHDGLPNVKLLLTGSSSLDLANKVKEPLTGRSRELLLYPLSLRELAKNSLQAEGVLEKTLIFGGYPGIWQLDAHRATSRLREIANQYLYRDAFALGTIYDQTVIDNLLRFLAFQVGNDVSYNEIASHLSISKETVMRYIDLLEKAFIVFRLNQYRKNRRVEVGRLRKVYFYDLGIRNAIIDNFKPLALRDDVGALWENFVLLERLKKHQDQKEYARFSYWRSRDKQEVDIVEEIQDKTQAFECKWKKETKIATGFKTQYPNIKVEVITKNNYWLYLR